MNRSVISAGLGLAGLLVVGLAGCSGSKSATGGGGTYQGTFSFAAQSGSITVVRKPL